MKIYVHLSFEHAVNSFLVVNENSHEALLIDPVTISETLIKQIEEQHISLQAILISHNYPDHFSAALRTLLKIYSPLIYGADPDFATEYSRPLRGDGLMQIAGFDVKYISLQTMAPNSHLYKIKNIIFTGNALSAGKIGETPNHAAQNYLRDKLSKLLLDQSAETILMPAYGAPSSIGTERFYNPAFHSTPKQEDC